MNPRRLTMISYTAEDKFGLPAEHQLAHPQLACLSAEMAR
jgi:hypothetical protein